MAILTMMVGLPGSGKTTYLETHRVGGIRLSLDDFRLLMTGREFFPPFEPMAAAWLEATGRYLLSHGYNIVIDTTSLKASLRRKWTGIAKEYGASTRAICMDTSYADCLERNAGRDRKVPEEILRRMSEDFEEPTGAEGWDTIEWVPAKDPQENEGSKP